MKNTTSMYVVTHKKFPAPEEPGYKLIHVGAALHQYSFSAISDAEGDSISRKNSNYCELTAYYWVWKNDHSSDIVGFVHYRRYFVKNWFSVKLLSCGDIEKSLRKSDVIVPNPLYMTHGNTIRTQYLKNHHEQDVVLTRKVIEEKYPDYLAAFDDVFNGKKMYPFNMCIMKKSKFDSYAEWLFDILFEVEKKLDISAYDSYSARVFGFLSERLMNVWIYKNHLKVTEKPVWNTEKNRNKQLWRAVKNRARYQLEKGI